MGDLGVERRIESKREVAWRQAWSMRSLSEREPMALEREARAWRRMTEGVSNAMEATGMVDGGVGVEGVEAKGGVVEEAASLWIGGEENLEAMVEKEPVEGVDADVTIDNVESLMEEEGDRGGSEVDCRGKAGTDNDGTGLGTHSGGEGGRECARRERRRDMGSRNKGGLGYIYRFGSGSSMDSGLGHSN
ncbi:hypothetical protein COCNU_13G005170 [Cocos nucifera]|uniref:Uncharacterized protein n=1 Tax=Cocos nucifera TaxID=13894 RepID=A0A8K0IT33_COCNU|nr:hypothetical protein COCNU_13G005170 [Cocos nucifera]